MKTIIWKFDYADYFGDKAEEFESFATGRMTGYNVELQAGNYGEVRVYLDGEEQFDNERNDLLELLNRVANDWNNNQ